MEGRDINISEILGIFKKRWKLILFFTVIATGVAAFISCYMMVPKYSSSTKFFIGKEFSGSEKYNLNDIETYQKFINTYGEFITTTDLIKNAIKANDLKLSPSAVISGLTVTPKTNTQILQLSYTCTDRELTKKVIDAVSDEFIKESKELIPNGDIKVIQQSVVPGGPIGPDKKKNIAIGFIIGAMIGVVIAFWLEYINNTVKNQDDLEEIMGVPVIGLIPMEK